MKKSFLAIIFFITTLWSNNLAQEVMNLEQLKKFIQGGEWISISTELRPFEDRLGNGKIQPFYVTRVFKYFPHEKFEGTIVSYADPFGKMPLVKFVFKGHVEFQGEHEIAKGAFKIDYILDTGFEVTPLHQMFADNLNQVPVPGLSKWEVGVMQDILKKSFPLFNIKEGEIVGDYDLIYVFNDMLFMGAKHVDGKGFDKPENRPTNLQVPLFRRK